MADDTRDLSIIAPVARAQKVIDWKNEAVVLFVRLPVVALFAGFGYVAWQLAQIWLGQNAEHIAKLTQIVGTCAGQ